MPSPGGALAENRLEGQRIDLLTTCEPSFLIWLKGLNRWPCVVVWRDKCIKWGGTFNSVDWQGCLCCWASQHLAHSAWLLPEECTNLVLFYFDMIFKRSYKSRTKFFHLLIIVLLTHWPICHLCVQSEDFGVIATRVHKKWEESFLVLFVFCPCFTIAMFIPAVLGFSPPQVFTLVQDLEIMHEEHSFQLI